MALHLDLLRPDDLLSLRIEGVNLRLAGRGDGAKLEAEDPSQPAYLIVHFPSQTITERAFFEASNMAPESAGNVNPDEVPSEPGNDPLSAPGTVPALMGGASRLVFRVPEGGSIPATDEGLLNWNSLKLSVHPAAAIGRNPTQAQIQSAPAIRAPTSRETALELPYNLILSPTEDTAWSHSITPHTHRGRTALWHSRMRLASSDEALSRQHTAPMRAIWSPDYRPGGYDDPDGPIPYLQRAAMSPDDRTQIVILTAAFKGFEVDIEIPFASLAEAATELVSTSGLSNLSAVSRSAMTTPLNVGAALVGRKGSVSALRQISIKKTVPFVPLPIEVESLMLSSLGGWLKSRGSWNPPRTVTPSAPTVKPDFRDFFNIGDIIARSPVGPIPGIGRGGFVGTQPGATPSPATPQPPGLSLAPFALSTLNPTSLTSDLGSIYFPGIADILRPEVHQLDLSEWNHIATQGRDHYVRIVYEGELWPFRHRAALIKVTERKFKTHGSIVGAYLMQRMFIVVRQPLMTFPATHRGSPFRRVRLTTMVTPDILPPAKIDGTQRSFWVRVQSGGSTPRFQFHAVGTDADGRDVDFTIPMIFVSFRDLPHASRLAEIAKEYNKSYAAARANTFGADVTFASTGGDGANENTRLPTDNIEFAVNPEGTPAIMRRARVHVPQIEDILGKSDPVSIRFFADYVKSGFDAGAEVFAEVSAESGTFDPLKPLANLVAATKAVRFTSDQAGGISTPDLDVSSLTRKLGPLAGTPAEAVDDQFDPSSVFPAGMARLFGTFDLADLLPKASMSENAPKMRTRIEGDTLVAELDWEPRIDKPLRIPDPSGAIAELEVRSKRLSIRGKYLRPLDGSAEGSFEMTGVMTDFRVGILKCVELDFDEFSFDARTGRKTDVRVRLNTSRPIRFSGDLEFVEEIRKIIPPDLFGDGPSLDITSTQVRAGFEIGLPPVAVGVFALRDVSLGASLTLPFADGKPVFDFNVSRRANPFLLSVGIFGGGGFFRLELDTAGLRMLEAALEFGATASLNIGVASGSVHMMAGIYFALERRESGGDLTAILSGYLRIGGSLNVLGIVRVSVEFNLSFTYLGDPKNKAYGRATLTICIEVALFSKTVELTVERQFGGSSADPTFGQLITSPDVWEQYALAFA
jgi:hypothetical protein